MKPFEFRLEKVLKLRCDHRDRMREELAMAVHAIRILEERNQQIEAEISEQRVRRHETAQERELKVERLIQSERYELVLTIQQQEIQSQIQQVSEEMETRRGALIEADREVKVLEKLREKQQQAHQKLEARADQQQLDEIGIQRAIRMARAARESEVPS